MNIRLTSTISIRARVKRFMKSQCMQIREGGLKVIWIKTATGIKQLAFGALIPFAFPIVVLIRAIRPWVHIRFGKILAIRIGHFSVETEIYLCERDSGRHPEGAIDFFHLHLPVSNQQLALMWRRRLHIFQPVAWLDKANMLLPGGQEHIVPATSSYDQDRLLLKFPAHLQFTASETRRGWADASPLRLTPSTPYICFHTRDAAYLNKVLAGYSQSNWDYHNYRDADIIKMLPAAEALTRRGSVALRMGAVVEQPLPPTSPQIIDYATKFRTDFLDVFLPAHCRFFLGGNTGITGVPCIFRVPMALTNYIPLDLCPGLGEHDLMIFKKLWYRDEKRFLTFREIRTSGASKFLFTQEYTALGVEPIENTADEITALAIEMDERLKGTWVETAEDKALYQLFLGLFPPTHEMRRRPPQIGAEFLRQNQWLLK